MDFNDLVKEKNSKCHILENKKPTIEEQIRTDVLRIVEYIKGTILLAAEKSSSDKFIYTELLCFSDVPCKTDKYVCGIVDYNYYTTTHKHLLFADKKITKATYTLNHNSEIFLSTLQDFLRGTGIRVDWKVCLLSQDTDYDLPHSVSLQFIGSRIAFLFVPQQDEAYSLYSGLFQYTKPVECVSTYDVIRFEKFLYWEWNYNNNIFHRQWGGPGFYLCLSVNYEN